MSFAVSLQRIHLSHVSRHDQCNVIRAAYERGFFAPFQKSLDSRSQDYQAESWWEQLQSIVSWETSDVERDALVSLTLMAHLLDPSIEESEKSALVQKHFSEEDYFDLLMNSPSCAGPLILQYASVEICRKIGRAIQEPYSRREKVPYRWIQQVLGNQGLYANRAGFFDQLLQCYPQEQRREPVFYFLLHSSQEEQRALFSSLSEPCRKEVESFCSEVSQFLENSLQRSSVGERVRIPFQGSQRAYFLRLFSEQSRDEPTSLVIAVSLERQDWEALVDYDIVSSALRWMKEMVQFCAQQEQISGNLPKMWCFFSDASAQIPVPERLSPEQRAEIVAIAQSFTPSLLAEYGGAFKSTQMIQALSPQQIVSWFSLYATGQRKPKFNETVAKELSEIWEKIESTRDDVKIICFGGENGTSFELTLYCSLSEEKQRQVLSRILEEQGVDKLLDWCVYVLSSDAEQDLLPFVKPTFFIQFHKTLRACDRFSQVRDHLEGFSEDALNLLLPTPDALPSEEQARAIRLFKQIFSRREMNRHEIRRLVLFLEKDLKAGPDWMQQLFFQFPPLMHPLLFLYLGPSVGSGQHPSWTSSREEWIRLAATTLEAMVDNPYFDDDSEMELAFKQLYSAVWATNALDQVMECFGLIAPAEKWLPTLNALGRFCFSQKRKDFEGVVARYVQAQPAKAHFIVDRFIAYDRVRGSYNPTDLNLLAEPFIATDAEAIAVIDAFVQRLGVEFFDYFLRWDVFTARMVRAVKAQPDRGAAILQNWIRMFASADKQDSDKRSILQRIGREYDHEEYKAFFTLLFQQEFEELLPVIESWYDGVFTSAVDSSVTGLMLLAHFSPHYLSIISLALGNLALENQWGEIAHMLRSLSALPGSYEVAEHLLSDKEGAFCQKYIEYVRREGVGEILSRSSDNEVMSRLTLELIENWPFELRVWTNLRLREKHEQNYRERDYGDLIRMYTSLHEVAYLWGWHKELKELLPQDLKVYLEELDRAYLTEAGLDPEFFQGEFEDD